MLQMVRLRSREEQERETAAMLERMQEQQDEGLEFNQREGEDAPAVREKKIPRNSPCPCGSGKKYKDCCGKSGPKKGILA